MDMFLYDEKVQLLLLDSPYNFWNKIDFNNLD